MRRNRKIPEDAVLAVEIGKRISYYRHRSRLSQTELANLVGIRQAPLSNLEQGKSLPSTRVLLKLSQTLGVPSDTILGVNLQTEDGVNCMVSNVYGDNTLILRNKKWSMRQLNTRTILPQLVFDLSGKETDLLAHKLRCILGCEHIVKLDFVSHLQWEGIHMIVDDISTPSAAYLDINTHEAWIFLQTSLSSDEKNYQAVYALSRIIIAMRDLAMDEKIKSILNQKDRFARAMTLSILMPDSHISRYVASNGIPEREKLSTMAEFFGVCREDLALRLNELGLI